MALFLITLWAAIGALCWLIVDQGRRGRFNRVETGPLDRALADSQLLRMPAEVAGTAIDDTVDLDDVKAMIVRMLIEGKLAAEVRGSDLVLKLLVPFSALQRKSEWQLAYSLFVQGETIDRASLMTYWKERDKIDPHEEVTASTLATVFTGKRFNIAEKIEGDLLAEGRAILQPGEQSTGRVRDVAVWLYAPFLLLGVNAPSDWEASMGLRPILSFRTTGLLVVAIVLHLLSMRLAERMRRKVSIGFGDIAILFLPIIAAAGTVARFLKPSASLTLLFTLLFVASIVNVALRARSTGERSRLPGAVAFIDNALASNVPMNVALVPYAFAFGFAKRVRAVRDEQSVDAFRACGGVGRLDELLDRFLEPFATVSGG